MILPVFHIIRLLLSLIYGGNTERFTEMNRAFNAASGDCPQIISVYESFGKPGQLSARNRILLSHCFFEQKDTSSMALQLKYLENARNEQIQQAYLNQLGLLTTMRGDTAEAIQLFKKAVESGKDNTFASRNFEYLSKVYHPNRQAPPQSRNDMNENNPEAGGEVEKSDKNDELLENQNPEISMAQALQLLEALKKNEFNKVLIVPPIKPDTTHYGNR